VILDTLEIARKIVTILEDKKGEDIILIDIQGLAIFADYFVICTGTSERMLKALADTVLEQVHKEFGIRVRLEGLPADGWLLADLGDVIVHLFSPERRDYYCLEELWSRGKVLLHLQ
jgi:ribosome-associated protein